MAFFFTSTESLTLVNHAKKPPRLSPYLTTWLHSLEGIFNLSHGMGSVPLLFTLVLFFTCYISDKGTNQTESIHDYSTDVSKRFI